MMFGTEQSRLPVLSQKAFGDGLQRFKFNMQNAHGPTLAWLPTFCCRNMRRTGEGELSVVSKPLWLDGQLCEARQQSEGFDTWVRE